MVATLNRPQKNGRLVSWPVSEEFELFIKLLYKPMAYSTATTKRNANKIQPIVNVLQWPFEIEMVKYERNLKKHQQSNNLHATPVGIYLVVRSANTLFS